MFLCLRGQRLVGEFRQNELMQVTFIPIILRLTLITLIILPR